VPRRPRLPLRVPERTQTSGKPVADGIASGSTLELWASFRRSPELGPCQLLLRKEVIQPHLPVRLPCYDFTPIASPTFGRSLPKGLGHGLRVLPTFVV
jgi:hypothetical protein